MQSEAARRWQRAKRIFDLVHTCETGEQSRILEQECGADEELRREVESLIEYFAKAQDFLETPITPVDSLPVTEIMPVPPGRIGPWRIVREIGSGGMGDVFLATRADDEYEKTVAIKVLRHNMISDFMVRRFRSERQILATLEHSNIARLIDGGTRPDGVPYLVMEYVEGIPITDFCDNSRLTICERLRVFLDVCAAVRYAHEKNIIHRDLKPTNVLVTSDGIPKLLDFGIARLIAQSPGADATATGHNMMTPAYASPEQLRGEQCTVASDVYSLGVLLYELLSGRRPGPANLAGSTTSAPSRAVLRRDDVTPEKIAQQRQTTVDGLIGELAALDQIVMKAICPAAADRHPSVEAFASRLRQHVSGESTVIGARTYRRSLAVLPFRIIGPDSPISQHLSIWLADSLITKLSALRNVSVSSTSAVMRYAGADPIDAGVELSADFVLEGRIYTTDTRIRLNVQLMNVRANSTFWAAQFDESLNDALQLEDSFSAQVSFALLPQLSGTEERERERQSAASAKAYQSYLKGRWYWSQRSEENLAKALVCFQQALAEDPQYARAHAGVADYYNRLGVRGAMPPRESFAAAKVAARRALAIEPLLAEAHASLGFALWCADRNYAGAETELQRAVELDPDNANPYHWLGMLYSSLGRHEEALANFRRAFDLDASAAIAARYAQALLNIADPAKALAILSLEHTGDPNRWLTLEAQAWCHLEEKNFSAAIDAAQHAVELSQRNPSALCCMAVAHAEAGDAPAARKVRQELAGMARGRYVSSFFLALISTALGEERACLRHLEKAVEQGDFFVFWTGVQRRFAPLRGNRRFQAILRALAVHLTEEITVRPSPKIKEFSPALIAVVLIALVGFGLWKFIQPARIPFAERSISKLTTDGTTAHAAISPDGKYVAYSIRVASGQELWIRRLGATVPVRLVQAVRAELHRIAFSSDSTYVTYVATPWTEPANAMLYRAPVIGGPPVVVMRNVPGPVSLSPDGLHIAVIRSNLSQRRDELIVVNTDGGGERLLASRSYPERFSWPSTPVWSADGSSIACGIEGSDADGFHVSLGVVRVRDGRVQVLERPRWQFLEQASWIGGRDSVLAVGQQADFPFQQIWYVPTGSRAPVRLINDLSDYTGLTVTSDGTELVSVRMQTITSVYVQRPGVGELATQVTPGSGRYFDLSWTPDGRLLYASDATGTADIWMMNADGSGRTQLTAGTNRSYSPVASPSGNLIVYHSNRSKNWNLWSMNRDGSGAKELTFGDADSNWPQFSPDGRWVVYHHIGPDATWNIWRVPVEGGNPEQLTRHLAGYPAINPKNGQIACWFSADVAKPHWQLAVLPPEGGEPLRTFSIPPTIAPDTRIAWTPDGRSISYIDSRDGAGNLWLQPLDGNPAYPLTSFTSGQIFSFNWSSDGRLAYSRGLSTSDAVLLRDTPK